MKNILFLIQDWQMPSSRIRVLNLVPELEKAGLKCEIEPYPHGMSAKLRMFRQCTRNHITYLQKKIPTPLETFLLKVFSRKLVFDFDDAVYCRHEAQGCMKSRGREIKSWTVLKLADLIIAGNRILKQYAEPLSQNVRIIPSAIEVRGLPVHAAQKESGSVIIGWIGCKINLPHLALITPVLQKLSKTRDIELHIVCDDKIDMPGVRITHIPWSLKTQEIHVAGFDIGIMPLPSSRHAQGKCGYKAIQSMAACIPVVVSDVGINSELVEHGVDGFVAADLAYFEKYLLQLIDSPSLRAQMGARARTKVENTFAVEQAGRQLAGILATL